MLAVRERPSLRRTVEVETPRGRRYRWAMDDPQPENVPNGVRNSSTMPGGHETADMVLPRKPSRDYADLEELSKLRILGPGGHVDGEYRLQASPRTSGDQMAISPSAVGYQAALEDDKTARFIYVSRDLSQWGPASVQRKLDLSDAGTYAESDMSGANPDATTGAPSLQEQISGAWTAPLPIVEAWFDAKGLDIGALYFAWKTALTTPVENDFHWEAFLSSDDVAGALDSSGDLASDAGSGFGTLNATARRRFALLQFWSSLAGGADGNTYDLFWPIAAIYGPHNLPLRGDLSLTDAPGLYSSDIEAHVLATFAPAIRFSTGPGGTIQSSSFPIPHLTFPDATTAGEMLKQSTRFELRDWAVWDGPVGPTYYSNDRGARGKHWRGRVGPAQLQETGPSVDRLWKAVAVQYQDETGTTRLAGWPGSGMDSEDAALIDPDPQNPANETGTPRRALLVMGTGTSAGAAQVGARFLEEQKAISTAGQARHVGHVEDDRGVLWPASRMRGGDTVTYVDAADPSPRRIVRADHSEADKASSVDLDAPPDAMQALLERLSVVLVPLGAS